MFYALEDCITIKLNIEDSNELIRVNMEKIISNQILQYFKTTFSLSKGGNHESRITHYFKQKTYSIGKILISEGSLPNNVMLLYSGNVKLVCKSKQQRTKLINVAIFNSPKWINDDCVYFKKESLFTINAITPIVVFEIGVVDFAKILDFNSDVKNFFIESITKKVELHEMRVKKFQLLRISIENDKKKLDQKLMNMSKFQQVFGGDNLKNIYSKEELKLFNIVRQI